MKRLIAIMAVLSLVFVLFAGCGKSSPSGGSDSAKEEPKSVNVTTMPENSIFNPADVTFVNDAGEPLYRIIRPDGCSDELKEASTEIFRASKSAFSATMKNVVDSNEEDGMKEILVGNTNRKESAEARDYLKQTAGGKKDDFIIGTVGEKIVIVGITEEGTINGVHYFIDNFFKTKTVAGGLYYLNVTAGDFKSVKILGHVPSDYRIIRPHLNFSYLAQAEIEKLVAAVGDEYAYYIDEYHDCDISAGECEIIVGMTDRDGCEFIADKDAYKISASGSKVYINGGSPHALAVGVTEFANMIKEGDITEKSSKIGTYEEAVAKYDKSKYYTYTWGDDFDGTALDSTKWYAFGNTAGMSKNTYDGRPMYRSNSSNNVWVSDGLLYMAATYTNDAFYGTMLSTEAKMWYRYGYAEISAIIADGDACWSAFWINNNENTAETGFRSEIDVAECFGNSSSFASNCHIWPNEAKQAEGYKHSSLDGRDELNARRKLCPDGRKFNDEMHTIGCLWTPTYYSFTCDGDIFFTYDFADSEEAKLAFSEYSYLYYSIFTGANGQLTCAPEELPPEQWTDTNKCICDYVNIYQLDDGESGFRIIQ